MELPPMPTHRPYPFRRQRGFTLVEIGVALGLIAILTALAVPLYGGWQDRLKVKRAQDDIIAMSMVIDTFLQDNGQLPANLGEVGRSGIADPWGQPYAYLALTPTNQGAARKDGSLVPLNTDYDLYSKGPDGASASPLTAKASRDDILRANNGRFVGPADKY
jgi:general secretion pathway protein G